MNKNYLMWLFLLTFGVFQAQTLNESAAWPNPAWTVTGNYSTNAAAFEANPTTSANFAFDDDDAGASHEDNIAAESPVIDLTSAHAAGEIYITAQAMYVYRRLTNDRVNFEYWNADTAIWELWETVPPNSTTINDNYCTGTKTLYKTPFLNIANFTPTQLAGFRYRIAFDDNPTGTGYVWGFCFDSPVLTSTSCASPFAFTVTQNSGTFTVTFEGGSAFEYVMSNEAATPAGAGTPIAEASFTVSGLTAGSTVYFHVRTLCEDVFSDWSTYAYLVPPANDECENAIALTVNADFGCSAVTAGTLVGATASQVPYNGAGMPDDDVWFSFVATSTAHRVELRNVSGTPSDLVHQIMSGACGSLVSVFASDPNVSNVTGLIPGETYYVRVFTYTTGSTNTTTFNVCVGTPPPPPVNDECSNATPLTVNADMNCAVTTPGTLVSATASPVPDNGAGDPDDDVWFSFVAVESSHSITISGVTGSPSDLVHEVMSGSCGALVSMYIRDPNESFVSGLTPGETYYVRVFSYGTNTTNTTNFNVCIGTAPAAPANDECDNAIALTVNTGTACTVTTPGSLVWATSSMIPANGVGNADDDVWFSFVATATTHNIAISGVTGSTTDLVHEVMSGSCGTFTSLLVSDPNTSVIDGLTIGETYYVRVYTLAGGTVNTTTFNICVATPPPPPVNDACENATSLTVNQGLTCTATTLGTLVSATPSGVPNAGTGMPDDDVWFSFVATSTIHHISITGVTGTPNDLVHQLMGGDCDNLVSLMITDPNNSVATGLTVGETYYIRVFTYATASVNTTTFNICVATPPAPPVNDLCADAVVIAVDSNYCNGSNTNGTNVSATPTTGTVESCWTGVQNDVWFTFTVPMNTTSVNVSTDFTGGTMTDSRVEVYSGSCGALVAMECDDDSGVVIMPNGYSWMSLIEDMDVTPGETYYVRVYSVNATTGTGTFCLDITSEDILSTENFQQSAFKAYPNPVTDVLNFETSRTITDVTVFSLLGQQVMAQRAGSVSSIGLSGLSAGTYFVKVSDGDITQTIKIFKK